MQHGIMRTFSSEVDVLQSTLNPLNRSYQLGQDSAGGGGAGFKQIPLKQKINGEQYYTTQSQWGAAVAGQGPSSQFIN